MSPPLARIAATVLVLLLAGRAMTLFFLPEVGSGAAGSAPAGWLMPLVGDAVIGLTAPVIAGLVWKQRALVAVVVWNALGIWDALSAYLVHLSVPWPEFFMLEWFGASMFFAASAMHIVVLGLVLGPGASEPRAGWGSAWSFPAKR